MKLIFSINGFSEDVLDDIWNKANERQIPLVYILDQHVRVTVGWDYGTLPLDAQCRCACGYHAVASRLLAIMDRVINESRGWASIGLSGSVTGLDRDEAEVVAKAVYEVLDTASGADADEDVPWEVEDDREEPYDAGRDDSAGGAPPLGDGSGCEIVIALSAGQVYRPSGLSERYKL